jgi:hypothetical protein
MTVAFASAAPSRNQRWNPNFLSHHSNQKLVFCFLKLAPYSMVKWHHRDALPSALQQSALSSEECAQLLASVWMCDR